VRVRDRVRDGVRDRVSAQRVAHLHHGEGDRGDIRGYKGIWGDMGRSREI